MVELKEVMSQGFTMEEKEMERSPTIHPRYIRHIKGQLGVYLVGRDHLQK